ncbi:hypothetical protein PBI_ZOEJ_77 [Mycobacterium phage ZoeJ]|uniref:Uncharacterized protein n=1 Tax=Mycobacterium phage ZoeJ TaxID=1486427 RepID=A0A023W5Q9_9CAUD|nr:hypothetical protein PBI_ZOEJ_77 [Mycobacterium phage ZoeJ]AHY26901.1 hypothetical protein PBI_ZOEJ_77 [Mycobacterium phage ZoeJ]
MTAQQIVGNVAGVDQSTLGIGAHEMTELTAGLTLHVFRHPLGDCTNDGVTSKADAVTLVGYQRERGGKVEPLPRMSQVFAPSDDAPAVVMVVSNLRGALPHLVPLDAQRAGAWTMAGGNIAGTSDSRFGELIEKVFDGPKCVGSLPVHDRIEK